MKLIKIAITTLSSVILAACASGPSDNLSLVGNEINQESSKSGSFTQPLKIDQYKPGCSGECPKFVVDSLIFPGKPKLSKLVDYALTEMTWIDKKKPAPYLNLQELQQYFWQTAATRDEIDLIARARFRTNKLTVVELNAGQYITGMAHGITGNQFINWDNATEKVVTLDKMLKPNARQQFTEQLKKAHANWLQSHTKAIDDPANFSRMWPFVASDNVGLTDTGLVIKYQPYEIAPYSFGQPELKIPYKDLKNILKDKYLPDNI